MRGRALTTILAVLGAGFLAWPRAGTHCAEWRSGLGAIRESVSSAERPVLRGAAVSHERVGVAEGGEGHRCGRTVRDHPGGVAGAERGLLVRELADMLVRGTRAETEYAAAFLVRAPEPLRSDLAAARADAEGAQPSLEVAEEPTAHRVPLRFDLRLLELPREWLGETALLGDIRGSCGGLGCTPVPLLLPPGSKSRVEHLEEPEVEIMGRAIDRYSTCEVLDAYRSESWPGEERSVRLGRTGVLTLSLAPSSDRRFVGVDLRLRFLDEDALVFVPCPRLSIPLGGTLLVQAEDASPLRVEETRSRVLLLTIGG